MNLKPKHAFRRHFLRRLFRNVSFGIIICIISLFIGILGYHYIEGMSWVDSYLNAAMILSGMGPVGELHTIGGKIFAGSYAIFSGAIFLVIIALVLSPVIHWVFVKFHMESK